jgi:hypothetical protein
MYESNSTTPMYESNKKLYLQAGPYELNEQIILEAYMTTKSNEITL